MPSTGTFERTTTQTRATRSTERWLLPPEPDAQSDFPGFADSGERAVPPESVRSCAPMGLVIWPRIVELAWGISMDTDATKREAALARWVLLRTFK